MGGLRTLGFVSHMGDVEIKHVLSSLMTTGMMLGGEVAASVSHRMGVRGTCNWMIHLRFHVP